MIPKIIHYCWFGRKPLPESAKKCVESWKRNMPDFEIKEWNESNYDVNKIPYIMAAYANKKYAFVSDYARFDILYHFGGIYFDTDVELLKPLDIILSKGAYMGCETDGGQSVNANRNNTMNIKINPGLGMAATPGISIFKEILDYYKSLNFKQNDGSLNLKTVVDYTTELLIKHGLKDIKEIQHVNDITVYPKEYFCPFDYDTKKINITSKTYSIHWYSATWMSSTLKKISELEYKYRHHPILKKLIMFPFIVESKFEQGGIKILMKSIVLKCKRIIKKIFEKL